MSRTKSLADRQRRTRFETFEERLALTAQSAWDAAADTAEMRQILHEFDERTMLTSPVAGGDFELEQRDGAWAYSDLQISPHLNDSHGLTGLNQVYNAYGFTGKGQTVVIIDSGIAYDHVALGGGFGSNYRVVGGWDFAENDANPYDDGPAGFHGTHVAGIVGSTSTLYRGVAPGVDLVALRVFDDNGAGYFSWTEQALQWVHQNRNAFENPITTVNLSLGTTWNSDSPPSWATLENEFAQLENDGMFISVSAGNSFTSYNSPGLSYPAASPYVVPVASVDNNGALSYFSQRNSRVIAAPGRSIMSTVPDYTTGSDGVPNDFASASGTSMAAPYVAGAAALVRQAMAFVGRTGITQDAIYDHLRSTADTVFDSITNANYSRLHLQRAIESLMPADDYGSSAATACALGSLTTSRTIAGLIGTTTDADYFTFTAGATGTATFRATATHDLVLNAQLSGGSATFRDNVLSFGVVAGQTYTISLGTTGGVGYYSIVSQIESAAPTAPGSLQAAALSASQVQLTWTDAAGESDYWIYTYRNGQSVYLDTAAANSTSYVVDGLTAGETHHFYVVAHNASGTTGSGWQGTTTFPSAPGSFRATAVSATSVDLAWTDAAGETEYWVYQYKQGQSVYLTKVAANTTSYRVEGLAAGETHHFYLVAHGASGNTGSGWQSSMTLPSGPANLKLSVLSANSVHLTWNDAAGESVYWIYQYKHGRSEYITSVAANATSFTMSGLNADETCHFYVVASNASGITGSGWQSVTMAVPTAPGSLQAATVNSSIVDISWTDSSGETAYWIYQWKNGRSEYLQSLPANSTTFRITGLAANDTYHFYVVAQNVFGITGSGWQSASTFAPSPAARMNLATETSHAATAIIGSQPAGGSSLGSFPSASPQLGNHSGVRAARGAEPNSFSSDTAERHRVEFLASCLAEDLRSRHWGTPPQHDAARDAALIDELYQDLHEEFWEADWEEIGAQP